MTDTADYQFEDPVAKWRRQADECDAGPPGPEGPRGDVGPQGPPGPEGPPALFPQAKAWSPDEISYRGDGTAAS